MSLRQILEDSTNVSVVLSIVDSADGTPETGVVFNTAGIDLWYRREGAAKVSITEVTLASLTTAHTDGGFLTISNGLYRFDIPDAAFATGAAGVQVGGTVTDMVVFGPYCEIKTIADVNVTSIGGDTTAGTNLSNQYDGSTGLAGDLFPATQAQLSNLAVGAGGLSALVDSFTNTDGGGETNTFESTKALDGVYHIIADNAGNTDFYYEFDIGVNGVSTEFVWDGYAQANNDTVLVFGFNWVSAAWVQIGNIAGTNAATHQEKAFIADTTMTGSGANAGTVRIRFDSSTSTNVATDRILCEFTSVANEGHILDLGTLQAATASTVTLDTTANANNNYYLNARVVTIGGTGAGQERVISDYIGSTKVATISPAWVTTPDSTTTYEITTAAVHSATQTPGYEDGAVWVDTINGTPGTLLGVNGTARMPVDNIADALTIAAAESLTTFHLEPSSSITLAAAFEDFEVVGEGWTIALGGQAIGGSRFNTGTISGIGTGTSRPIFRDCRILSVTLPSCTVAGGAFQGTFTLTNESAAPYAFSNNSSTSGFVLDYDSSGINNTVNLTGFNSLVTVDNMGQSGTDSLLITGNSVATLNASCIGGSLVMSGVSRLTDNSTGMTQDLDAQVDNLTINAQVDEALVDYDAATGAEIAALNDVAATDIVSAGAITTLSGAVANVDLVDVTTVNTDMKGTDGANTVAPDNAGISANGVAIGNLNNITAADVLAAGDIDGFDLEDASKIILSAAGGKLSGAATSTNTLRAADDSKDRITATVDADGNRSAVTLDGTG